MVSGGSGGRALGVKKTCQQAYMKRAKAVHKKISPSKRIGVVIVSDDVNNGMAEC